MMTKELVVRRCRVCGCTEDDCRRCIEKTGQPCHWVEKDLCSACEEPLPEPEIILQNIIEGNKEIDKCLRELQSLLKTSNETDMQFFTKLQSIAPGSDVTMCIKEKNGTFTISIINNIGAKTDIKPMLASGTPQELDAEFFERIGPQLREVNMQLYNLEEYKKSMAAHITKETENAKPGKKETSKASAKPAAEKAKPKSVTKEEKPAKPDLFAEDAEEPASTETAEQDTAVRHDAGEEEDSAEVADEQTEDD